MHAHMHIRQPRAADEHRHTQARGCGAGTLLPPHCWCLRPSMCGLWEGCNRLSPNPGPAPAKEDTKKKPKRMRLQASRVGGTVWLSYWTESTDSSGHAPHGAFWYLGVYAGISGIQVLLLSRTHAVASFSLTWVCCRVLVACVMAGYDSSC